MHAAACRTVTVSKSLFAIWTIDTYFPNFVNFGPRSATAYGDLHQSFTGALVAISLEHFRVYIDLYSTQFQF